MQMAYLPINMKFEEMSILTTRNSFPFDYFDFFIVNFQIIRGHQFTNSQIHRALRRSVDLEKLNKA